ncbi:MAG TPA: hypothetical protein VF230_02840 [Acidimicrobiales bacterium]
MSPHPIERLRWVARAQGAGPSVLAREAAAALASVGDDPAALVTGCRRIIERHPAAGPLWWLAARMLASGEPVHEAWAAAEEIDGDETAGVLAAHLPDDATVTVLGWPELAADALRRRGDVEALVVDVRGEGSQLVGALEASGIDAYDVMQPGLGAAVQESAIVLLEAEAVGPASFVASCGSLAAAGLGRSLGREVWLVAGVGRVLPGRLWDALASRVVGADDPWDLDVDIVPLEWVTTVAGPSGPQPVEEAVRRADCPIVPELLRWEK